MAMDPRDPRLIEALSNYLAELDMRQRAGMPDPADVFSGPSGYADAVAEGDPNDPEYRRLFGYGGPSGTVEPNAVTGGVVNPLQSGSGKPRPGGRGFSRGGTPYPEWQGPDLSGIGRFAQEGLRGIGNLASALNPFGGWSPDAQYSEDELRALAEAMRKESPGVYPNNADPSQGMSGDVKYVGGGAFDQWDPNDFRPWGTPPDPNAEKEWRFLPAPEGGFGPGKVAAPPDHGGKPFLPAGGALQADINQQAAGKPPFAPVPPTAAKAKKGEFSEFFKILKAAKSEDKKGSTRKALSELAKQLDAPSETAPEAKATGSLTI
jgi:hypothetical protein